MNIFTLHRDPHRAASMLYDVHTNSQLKEAAHMLSNFHRAHNVDVGYRPTHIYHPCTKWVQHSPHNYAWLLAHAEGIMQARFERTRQLKHKCWDDCIMSLPHVTGDWHMATPPALAFAKEYTGLSFGLTLDHLKSPIASLGIALKADEAWDIAVFEYRMYYMWELMELTKYRMLLAQIDTDSADA